MSKCQWTDCDKKAVILEMVCAEHFLSLVYPLVEEKK